MLWSTREMQSPEKGVHVVGTQEILRMNIIVLPLREDWNMKLEKENMKIWRKTIAGNCTLCAAHTCSNVPASAGFIENVAREGGCTDDQKARGHHDDDPEKHQDCPETTVN